MSTSKHHGTKRKHASDNKPPSPDASHHSALDTMQDLSGNLPNDQSEHQMQYQQYQEQDPSVIVPGKYTANIIQNEDSWALPNKKFKGLDEHSILGNASKKNAGGGNTYYEEELKESRSNTSTISKTRQNQSSFSISNEASSKKRGYNEISNQMSMQNTYFQQLHEQQDDNNQELKTMHARELERHMKSKKQLYDCLTLEGQLYLPPYNDCTVTFMQQLMSRKKLYFVLNDLCSVKVPHFIELSASRVFKMAMSFPEIACYLPDFNQEKPLNRAYLFNIVNTIDQEFFFKNIPEAFQLRKDWNGHKQKKMVEIDPFFANLIQNSNMITSNRNGRVFSGFAKLGQVGQVQIKQRTKHREYQVGQTFHGGKVLGQHSAKVMRGNEGQMVRQGGLQNQFGQSIPMSAHGTNSLNQNQQPHAFSIIPTGQYLDSSQNQSLNSAQANSVAQPQTFNI